MDIKDCTRTKNSPVVNTLYAHCLFEVIKEAQDQGKETVDFIDVDKLVVRKSMSIIYWEFDKENKDGH